MLQYNNENNKDDLMKKIFIVSLFLFLSACSSNTFHKNETYNTLLTELFSIMNEERLTSVETENRINYDVTGAMWWCLSAEESAGDIEACYVDFLVEYDYLDQGITTRQAGFIRVGAIMTNESIVQDNDQLVLSSVYGLTREENWSAFTIIYEQHKNLGVQTNLLEGRELQRKLP